MRELLIEIYRRDRVLAIMGWLHVGLLLTMLLIAPFDSRTVLGLNPWIKPAKFAVSIAIYAWTLAWFMKYIVRPRWAIQVISWGVTLAMIAESVCLVTQSVRGTTSHFNNNTPFDGMMFATMGIMITLNTLLVLMLTVLFFIQPTELPRAYLWGIRLGLILFLLAGFEGSVMIANKAHTVGAADGGAGLPLVNWSTRAGDLRIAHALGLHALQILPLVGYSINTWKRNLAQSRRVAFLLIFALIYTTVAALLFWQAMRGQPLIAFT